MNNKDQQSEVDEAGKEAGLEQAVVPGDGDAASGRRRPKWLVPVIVAVVAVMVVVAGLLGWRVVESRRHGADALCRNLLQDDVEHQGQGDAGAQPLYGPAQQQEGKDRS